MEKHPKTVITYGTFDLLHYGHILLFERAKKLGDRLIVAVSSDEFNELKGKHSFFNLKERIAMVAAVRYVDEVIVENNWEQKESDIDRYHVDVFVMGDDWKGKFDYLRNKGVEVVYLPRTPDVSTTGIKEKLHEQ